MGQDLHVATLVTYERPCDPIRLSHRGHCPNQLSRPWRHKFRVIIHTINPVCACRISRLCSRSEHGPRLALRVIAHGHSKRDSNASLACRTSYVGLEPGVDLIVGLRRVIVTVPQVVSNHYQVLIPALHRTKHRRQKNPEKRERVGPRFLRGHAAKDLVSHIPPPYLPHHLPFSLCLCFKSSLHLLSRILHPLSHVPTSSCHGDRYEGARRTALCLDCVTVFA
mmetsp:Transcript_63970/g.176713  ORF Transcript_63970/g.176713 Transcript_63970/m.176713 type:complete len:223 (-) Transcript_63970:585-1253(-)